MQSSSFECKTAWEMTWSSVTFGCQALDNLLEGGLPSRGITEIYGESASGKSQICMQLAVAAQLPPDRGGTGRGVVYFTTTGGVFPSQRLFQIIETFKVPQTPWFLLKHSWKCHLSQERHPNLQLDYMSNIFIQSQLDLSSFLSCLREKLPAFLQSHKIGLIIVDSLGIFRTETNAVTRSKNLRVNFAQQLKKLADLHDFAIVCVNEVVSVPNHETTIPSLGVSWSNIVTTRLRVARSHKTTKDGNVIRIMSIDHSGTLPRIIGDAAEFIVTSNGICDIYWSEIAFLLCTFWLVHYFLRISNWKKVQNLRFYEKINILQIQILQIDFSLL